MEPLQEIFEYDVSVIIVNYFTSELVADCVSSIIEQTSGVSYEVIISDNNSENDFREKIIGKVPMANASNFSYISSRKNNGFGKANNIASLIAKGKYIFFLNPDTILLNNAIKILSDFLETHEDAGACGGNLYNISLAPTYSYKRFLPGVFWEFNELLNTYPERMIYGKDRHFNYSEKPLKVGYITGADLMMPIHLFHELKGFCHDFFLYYEESDLCKRIHKAGKNIYSVPAAKIVHLESKSMETTQEYQSDFKTRNIERSRRIYYDRNVKGLPKIFSHILYRFYISSRISLLKDGPKREYYRARKRYFLNKDNQTLN